MVVPVCIVKEIGSVWFLHDRVIGQHIIIVILTSKISKKTVDDVRFILLLRIKVRLKEG